MRFEEVDAARIVFFGRYMNYAHEAMEGLVARRRLPTADPRARDWQAAVDVHVKYSAPLRYGDELRVLVTTAHLGRRSATLRYRFVRASDGVQTAELTHTVVTSDLRALASIDMPADVRATFEAHTEPGLE